MDSEYLGTFSFTERDRKLLEFAERYHKLTEDYDRTVCTGPIVNGSILSVTPREAAKCANNARMVRRDIEQQSAAHQISPDELWKAICDHRPRGE